jgi:hypothetical protein
MRFKRSCVVIVLLLFSSFLSTPNGVRAAPPEPLDITEHDDGVRLAWQGAATLAPTSRNSAEDWPLIEINGARVPGQLVALRVADSANVTPQIVRLTTAPWAGALDTADTPALQNAEGESRADLSAPRAQTLPDTPVSVLREGRMRGVRIVVLAVSQVFEQNGARQALTDLEVVVPNATLFEQDIETIMAASGPFLAAAAGPSNPSSNKPAATVRVTQAGVQRVTGASLASAGLNLSDATKIHVTRNGATVAAEVRDGGDGRLDAADELRFYAPSPGDRWNAADTYWITVEATPGLRMGARAVAPGSAPVRDTAYASGVWRNNKIYDPTLSGPDNDHWFAVDLRTGPGQSPARYTAQLTSTLPLAPGTATITTVGSAYTRGQHQLQIGRPQVFLPLAVRSQGSGNRGQGSGNRGQGSGAPEHESVTNAQPAAGVEPAIAVWNGTGDWSHTFTLAENTGMVEVTLVPGAGPDGVELDHIAWQRPVFLNFNGRGAAFEGVPGDWQYQLSNLPAERTLYDMTDPNAPVVVALPGGSSVTFQDGPQARQYLLASGGTLHTPEAVAHTPVDLASPLNADALYIAPASFHATLAPLVALRQSQGHTVRVVDVQAIYNAWSFGQVAPEAIRAFLRYAAATWSKTPKAVTLVGDGTVDPFNYTNSNRDGVTNNRNIIPPYLALVDPWLRETACETCYALLDTDDPLADTLPDLAVGRFPIRDTTELARVVEKIRAYETAPFDPSWRGRVVYLADNYREADGRTDPAGDFAAFADASAALQPGGTDIQRVYYDPAAGGEPWREPDPTAARAKALAALNTGAGIINYVGHSNQFQVAVTNLDPRNGPGHLLTLYDPDELSNSGRAPIVLQMTCLTGAFQTPAFSGTTIDERMLLAPNAAVAVWGASGKGVSFGHDSLQRGFYIELWQKRGAGAIPALGTLTTAGYKELFTKGTCCQDTIRTFLLLGDPLTPARVGR